MIAVTNSKATDELAAEVRDLMRRKPYLLEQATDIADDTIAELHRRMPDLDPAIVGAILLRVSGHLGTHLLHALADEPLKADRFHLLAMNAMAVAGERLYATAAPDPGGMSAADTSNDQQPRS